jgi:tetratricopeptide (TPR) repeat protein
MFTIGNAFLELEDFPNAYKYHADAFKIIKHHPDPVYRQNYLYKCYGCVARCQMNMKYYSLAIKNYKKAINLIEANMSDNRYSNLRKYMDDCSHCYAMLGQFQGACALWANYRRQADIGFFKKFDFMIDMALFNVQTNKKKEFSNFRKKMSKNFDLLNLNLKNIFQILQLKLKKLIKLLKKFVKLSRPITQSFLKIPKHASMLWNP